MERRHYWSHRFGLEMHGAISSTSPVILARDHFSLPLDSLTYHRYWANFTESRSALVASSTTLRLWFFVPGSMGSIIERLPHTTSRLSLSNSATQYVPLNFLAVGLLTKPWAKTTSFPKKLGSRNSMTSSTSPLSYFRILFPSAMDFRSGTTSIHSTAALVFFACWGLAKDDVKKRDATII